MSFGDFFEFKLYICFSSSNFEKFTITGSPNGDKCNQNYVIEGPGLRGWFQGEGYVDDKWTTNTATNDCLSLNGYPLKVYASRDLTYYHGDKPIDGLIRNVAFTNTASDTTIQSPCTEEIVEAALFLSSFRPSNKPLVLGLDGKSIKNECS